MTRKQWLVLRDLADRANDETRQCWPSVAEIVDTTSLAGSTVWAALARFRAEGIVLVVQVRPELHIAKMFIGSKVHATNILACTSIPQQIS